MPRPRGITPPLDYDGSTALPVLKEEEFAQGDALHGNASRAAREAGVKGNASAWASKAKKRKRVELRIAYLTRFRGELAEKHFEGTVGTMLTDQDQIVAGIKDNIKAAAVGSPVYDRDGRQIGNKPDFQAVNRGHELHGRAKGLFDDSIQQTAIERQIDEAQRESLIEIIKQGILAIGIGTARRLVREVADTPDGWEALVRECVVVLGGGRVRAIVTQAEKEVRHEAALVTTEPDVKVLDTTAREPEIEPDLSPPP